MSDKKEILELLRTFTNLESIKITSDKIPEIKYKPIKTYIENLKVKVKPETAAGELLKKIFDDITIDEKKEIKVKLIY